MTDNLYKVSIILRHAYLHFNRKLRAQLYLLCNTSRVLTN